MYINNDKLIKKYAKFASFPTTECFYYSTIFTERHDVNGRAPVFMFDVSETVVVNDNATRKIVGRAKSVNVANLTGRETAGLTCTVCIGPLLFEFNERTGSLTIYLTSVTSTEVANGARSSRHAPKRNIYIYISDTSLGGVN